MATPNFEYDLFISYAHIDNQYYSGVPQGWVDYLHERLQVSLSRRLGRAPRIWRDRKLRGNEVFDDEIKQTLASTAIFLPVMSPRYLESTSCRAEVQDGVSKLLTHSGARCRPSRFRRTARSWPPAVGAAR
jgi:TIR domain-containing protein